MEYFYNQLWQVYRYGQTAFECMTSNEQLKLMREFIKDCEWSENGGESGIYAEYLEDVIQDIQSMAAQKTQQWRIQKGAVKRRTLLLG